MNHVILFDSDIREQLLPLTFTRPVSELRLGILTIREKWSLLFRSSASFSHITSNYLEPLYPIRIQDENILINGAVVPSKSIFGLIENLALNEALMLEGELIAARLPRHQFNHLLDGRDLEDLTGYELNKEDVTLLRRLWEIPDLSRSQVRVDMDLLPRMNRKKEKIDISGTHEVFIHEDAKLELCTINATEGPVYIGKDAMIMDGSMLRGPIAIGQGSVVRMGAKLFGGTVIGPSCVVGGEVKNSTLLGYSNKAHEGYLGDSVIGEWCNLGALTSNSNLRNTFTNVKVWNYVTGKREDSGRIKCGVFMGDYSRTAILASLGAGTVIGVSCHVFGQGFTKPFIPSFTWGGTSSLEAYELEKALKSCLMAQSFKGKILEAPEKELLRQIAMISGKYHRVGLH